MTENLELWNSVKDVDPTFVKEVSYGRKYKSANPMKIIEMITEEFGPIGVGWGADYVVTRDDFPNGETVYTADMTGWRIGEDGEKAFFSHCGVCKGATLSKEGVLRVDEEAKKKAVTNAYSKTFSLTGFAASIYMGYYDSPAYLDSVKSGLAREEQASKIEFMLARLKSLLTHAGADEASDDDDVLCRLWSGGQFGCVEAREDAEKLKATLDGQSKISVGTDCEMIPMAKQLEEARKLYS